MDADTPPPPKLGQFFAGRCPTSSTIVAFHYVEPVVNVCVISPDNMAFLSGCSKVCGFTKERVFLCGVPGVPITAKHVSLDFPIYLQGACGDTLDESVKNLGECITRSNGCLLFTRDSVAE